MTTTGLLPIKIRKAKIRIPKYQAAHAILTLGSRYIMQLRDSKLNIPAPGQWIFFGGALKIGEKPVAAVKREIFEELSITPNEYHYLWFIDYYSPFYKNVWRIWFFYTDVERLWHRHILREGKEIGIFEFKQLTKLDMPLVMRQALERFSKSRTKSNSA